MDRLDEYVTIAITSPDETGVELFTRHDNALFFVKNLANIGVDVDEYYMDGAIKVNNQLVIDYLISSGISINFRHVEIACQFNNLDVIKRATLMNDWNYVSLLEIAIKYNSYDVVKFLLNNALVVTTHAISRLLEQALNVWHYEIADLLLLYFDIHFDDSKQILLAGVIRSLEYYGNADAIEFLILGDQLDLELIKQLAGTMFSNILYRLDLP
jgi:hypothetical protein